MERPSRKGVPIPRKFEHKAAQRAKERLKLIAADKAFGGTKERLEALYGAWRDRQENTPAFRREKYINSPGLLDEDAKRETRIAKACEAHLADLRRAYPGGMPLAKRWPGCTQ